jgi:hypothetical protein
MKKEVSEYEALLSNNYQYLLFTEGLAASQAKMLELAGRDRIAGQRLKRALDFVIHECQGMLNGNISGSFKERWQGIPTTMLQMISALTGDEIEIPEYKEPVNRDKSYTELISEIRELTAQVDERGQLIAAYRQTHKRACKCECCSTALDLDFVHEKDLPKEDTD